MPFYKKVLLLALSACSIFIMVQIPFYKDWLQHKILPKYELIDYELDNMEPEQRRALRYGTTYAFCVYVREQVLKSKFPKDVVLLPSKGFVSKHKLDLSIPEPVVFYYYSGIRTVWPNSKDALSARWIVEVRPGAMRIIHTQDPRMVQAAVTEYKKYEIGL